jgi:hypothetical protein
MAVKDEAHVPEHVGDKILRPALHRGWGRLELKPGHVDPHGLLHRVMLAQRRTEGLTQTLHNPLHVKGRGKRVR